jgi:hypothetical protein
MREATRTSGWRETVEPNARHGRSRRGRHRADPGRGPDSASQCRRRFLRFFPGGFRDETYLDWERGYKVAAHARWEAELGPEQFGALIKARCFGEIAARAIRIEFRTNLLFSFEKMALRDAARESAGAEALAKGLYRFLYGRGAIEARFVQWCTTVAGLPRRQTRVLERGLDPTFSDFTTLWLATSITKTEPSSSEVTQSRPDAGSIDTPSGSAPILKLSVTCSVPMSTTLAFPASSFAMNTRVPSPLTASCSGSVPLGSTLMSLAC